MSRLGLDAAEFKAVSTVFTGCFIGKYNITGKNDK